MRDFLRAVIIAAGLFWFFIGAVSIGLSSGQLSPMKHALSILFLLVTTSAFFWFAIRLKSKPSDGVSLKKKVILIGKYWLIFYISAFILSICGMILLPMLRKG